MTKATAILWNKYKFHFEMPKNPTLHELAWEIAMAVHRAEKRTKFTGTPRCYNYVSEALRQNPSTFNFMRYNAESDKKEEIYRAANELQADSKFKKVKCDSCHGTGYNEGGHPANPEKIDCFYCNGHGYLWKRISYRVGDTFDFALVIDIDEPGEENMRVVKEYYQKLLGFKFRVFRTNGGYWMIADHYVQNKSSFRYYHCKILNPELQARDMNTYIEGLMALDKKDGMDFMPATPEVIKASEFYKAPAHLDFDVAFTFLSIKREQSTLRQSAKFKGDKIVEVL